MKNVQHLFFAILILVTPLLLVSEEAKVTPPNIVIILADDLGYGDVHCNNPERGKISTPCMDELAAQGMRFTDAHSSSAVCTPSRYSILTGRYHWRTRLQKGVIGGTAKALIAPDRLTLASVTRQAGYSTACIGKWHLGMDIPNPVTEGRIQNGPITRGFDYYFGVSASADLPPYAFIENDHFTESPTATKCLLKLSGNEKSRMGPAAPGFETVNILPTLARKSVEWIGAQKGKPFFLYLALTSPHTPIAPSKEWKGRSGLGDYADFVMQTDAVIGEVMQAIKGSGLSDNTLVVVTSDNGCAPYAGTGVFEDPADSNQGNDAVKKLEEKGHFPSGPLLGYKCDAWDGGHRVPFIVSWPKVVPKGRACDQLVIQTDLMATIAEMTQFKLPENAGEDSFSLLPLLRGENITIRENAIHQSGGGFSALRVGSWKYIPTAGSGGWSKGGDRSQPVQLYNLADDLGETKNLAASMPEKVATMDALLEKLITDGRSTPGAAQKNDVPVVRLWKHKANEKASGADHE